MEQTTKTRPAPEPAPPTPPKVPEDGLSRAIRRLRTLDDDKRLILAHIAHEIRNPTNAMIGFSEMLRDEVHGEHSDPRYKEYADLINETSNKLLDICNRLVDQGRETIKKTKTVRADAATVIGRSAELYKGMAARRGVGISVWIDEDFPNLAVPSEVLEDILGNLISNAIKFTPKGGRVSVRAMKDPDGATILVVSDTGVGMSKDALSRSGQAGPVTPATGAHGDVGSGFGLEIVRERLAPHGVYPRLTRNAQGGTTVTLDFPKRAIADGS